MIIRSTQNTERSHEPKDRALEPGRGKLKIGDDWNAITIIALSQTSPLKAIAELVENSIDAKARTVTITRGREHRRHFLSIRDDGEGVPRDNAGRPDFRYVATHIRDSVSAGSPFCGQFVARFAAHLLYFVAGGIVRYMPLSRTQQPTADLFWVAGAQEPCRTPAHHIRQTVRCGREHRG